MSRLILYNSPFGTVKHLVISGDFITMYCLDARSECTGTVTTEEQSDITNLSRCMTGIRRFFTFLFSHIGLLALVSGYCILGGLTFQHLEKENELQVNEIKETRLSKR